MVALPLDGMARNSDMSRSRTKKRCCVVAGACVAAVGTPALAELTAAEAAAAFVSAAAAAGYEVESSSTVQGEGTLSLQSVRIGEADEPFGTELEPAWIRFSERPDGSVAISVPESIPVEGAESLASGAFDRISTSGLESVLRREGGIWEIVIAANKIAAIGSGATQRFENDIGGLEFRMTLPDADSSAPVTTSGSFARFGINESDLANGTVFGVLVDGAEWDATIQLAEDRRPGDEGLQSMELSAGFGPVAAWQSVQSRDMLRYSSAGSELSLRMDAPWEVSAAWNEREQAVTVAGLGGVTVASSKYALDSRPARNGSRLVSTLRSDVDGIFFDEATRRASDVVRRLPQDPASLRSDVSLTIPGDLMQSGSRATPRSGAHRIDIQEIVLSWAGASLTASGEIRMSVDYDSDEDPEFQALNVDVRADGVLSLLSKLSSAGVLSREEAAIASTLLSTYGQRIPGERDSLLFRFEARPGLPPLLNGRPLPN